MIDINVPDHVTNPSAYIAAAHARIKINARKGRSTKWFADHDDAQQITDWLNATGEFAGHWEVDGTVVSDEQRDENEELWNNSTWIHHPASVGRFSGDFGDFIMGLHNQLFEFGSLSDKQTQIVREALARKLKWVADAEKNHAAALEADRNSTFVGELKERRDWVLVIKKVISFESQWGYVYINIMKDQDGNVIIGKGSKQYGTEGTTVKLKATIVKHDTREGIKQTFVNRPKFEV